MVIAPSVSLLDKPYTFVQPRCVMAEAFTCFAMRKENIRQGFSKPMIQWAKNVSMVYQATRAQNSGALEVLKTSKKPAAKMPCRSLRYTKLLAPEASFDESVSAASSPLAYRSLNH
ncbi:hypothetical protein C8J56DRAFT_1040410 [Mycena floridula]|nr:hypothetical protein C8J56DRAFT_1040410 [Mycena floridula]